MWDGPFAAETSQEHPPSPFMGIKDGKNEISFQLTSSTDRREKRGTAPSQLSVVSLLHLCVSLARELLGLEVEHIWMSGTEREKSTQGSGKEQVSLT